MRTEAIFNTIYNYRDIPQSLTTAIKALFNVQELTDLSASQRQHLRQTYLDLFRQIGETNYHNIGKEYTLRYFPVNFFKIWLPLYDLLMRGQIKENCTVLELGCGPGSSTMGFIEFYRILASENPSICFKLDFVLVEREQAFCDVVKKLHEQYSQDFPKNLNVNITFRNEDIEIFFAGHSYNHFDYIIESNMLNPNEKVDSSSFGSHCDSFMSILKPHSAIILIEPGKKGLSEYLYQIKNILVKNGLSVFSPCTCDNELCKMFSLARVKTSGISLINDSRSIGVFNEKKDVHYFEYVVIRNDSLKKYEKPKNSISFYELSSYVGKTIKFEAFILHCFDKGDYFDLKICDGSRVEHEVFMRVPKRILTAEFVNTLSIGRGNYVKVKNAKVVSEREITCSLSTMIDIM